MGPMRMMEIITLALLTCLTLILLACSDAAADTHCLTKECYRNAPCLRPDATECWSHKVSGRIQPLKPRGAGQRSQEDPPQSIGGPDLRVLHAGDPPY